MSRALDLVHVPRKSRRPGVDVFRRVGLAAGLVVFVALVVFLGRDGYTDSTDSQISALDAFYYASVTVTTTGYGDITAVSDGARLATVLLITPARIMFLILVVSTTVEVLTVQARENVQKRRWRSGLKDHIIICGYGATGQSAADDLLRRGVSPDKIVLVDLSEQAVKSATERGLTAIRGDATRSDILTTAAVREAQAVIVAPNRDDTAVLITLTVRELNSDVHIVAGGREQENLHLLRQGGANEVIDATAAVGRMLGLGTYAPGAVGVMDEILDAGRGLELVEVSPVEVDGQFQAPEDSNLVAVIRSEKRLPAADVGSVSLQRNDRLVVVRDAN